MIHYCYRTTNKITGEFYIGKRTTLKHKNWFSDPYLGSGIHLDRAIKKYGKENFVKVILCYAETKEENAANEILFVGELWKDDDCYNLMPGGEGGSIKGRPSIMKGKTHSEKTRYKISKSMKGRTFSEEHRRKLSEAKKAYYARKKENKESKS